MDQKIIGAILLSAAGVVAAIGATGGQIAFAILRGLVQGGYAIGHTGGTLPDPSSPHWLVLVMVAVLGFSGLFFLFSKSKSD